MIALDPEQTWRIGFDIEANKPDDQRRWLVCRFGTARQRSQIKELSLGSFSDGIEEIKRMEIVGNALAICALEWILPIAKRPYKAEDLADLCTWDEATDLVRDFLRNQALTESERKKSALQSASAAQAKSAGDAPGMSA